jgi:hypothetical protein
MGAALRCVVTAIIAHSSPSCSKLTLSFEKCCVEQWAAAIGEGSRSGDGIRRGGGSAWIVRVYGGLIEERWALRGATNIKDFCRQRWGEVARKPGMACLG